MRGNGSEEDRIMYFPLLNIFYLGVQKSGSTSLSAWPFDNGIRHPKKFPSDPEYAEKEVHYFNTDNLHGQGTEFHSKRFQHCADNSNITTRFTMNATPNYFLYPDRVHGFYSYPEAADTLSRLKLIVTLREPMSREMPIYYHKVDHFQVLRYSNAWYSDITFENGTVVSFDQYTSIFLKHQVSNPSSKSTGKYVDHLKHWVTLFGYKKILVLSCDKLKEHPSTIKKRIGEFWEAHLQVRFRKQ